MNNTDKVLGVVFESGVCVLYLVFDVCCMLYVVSDCDVWCMLYLAALFRYNRDG